MSNPITSDALTQARAGELRTLLNAGHTLRLFRNDFTPALDSVLADFTEANYGGYAAADLAGQFGAIVQIQPGEWQFAAGPFTFQRTSAPLNQIYGWYVADATDWRFAQRFAFPIQMDLLVSFQLNVRPQDWALNLLLPA